MRKELNIKRAACANIPTAAGSFQLCVYENNQDRKEHLAILVGDVEEGTNVLVRIHSECFTGDVLGSRRCDCGDQLHAAMNMIGSEGRGIILYLRQEGRGIGLAEKLKAYNLQDQGLDTVDANLALGHAADARDYSIAAAILDDLGVRSVRLITNNPDKIDKMERLGVKVTERVASETAVYPENAGYLLTKAQRMDHLLDPLTLTDELFVSLNIMVKVKDTQPARGSIGLNGQRGHNGYEHRRNNKGRNGYSRYHNSPTV
jgi:GTP cyclohydrolase II